MPTMTRVMGSANKWLSKNKRAQYTVTIAMISFAISHCLFSNYRHYEFNSAAFDLGIQDQVVWNTSQGRWFGESIEVQNYFGDHVQPLLALLAVPYRLVPSVFWLFLFQAVVLGLAALPIRHLAARELESPLAGVVFSLVYLLYPPVGYISRFDFHFEVLAVPALLAAWNAARASRLYRTSLWLALAMLAKEEIGLTVALYGLLAGLALRRFKFALAWGCVGVMYSLIALLVVIPMFRGEASDTLQRYAWLGRTPDEMIFRVVSAPGDVLRGIGHIGWRHMCMQLFAPVGGATLWSIIGLILISPGMLYNLLSSEVNQHQAYYQYVVPMIPGVFIGAIYGVKRLARLVLVVRPAWHPDPVREALLCLVAVSSLTAFAADNPFRDNGIISDAWTVQPNAGAIREAIGRIGAEANVVTTNQYGSHLSHRTNLKIYSGGKPGEILRGRDVVLLSLLDVRSVSPEALRGLLLACRAQGFGATFEADGVVLLERGRGSPESVDSIVSRWFGDLKT